MILALAGGVGGSKLANGFAKLLSPDELVVAVNTGDDFCYLGLHVSPDLDTIMYTLGGCNNTETGWGLAGESWHFMDALARFGGETWFLLGDRDLATHIERTRRLKAGESLSAVTQHLCRAYGVAHRVVPMSDDAVRTVVHTDAGALAFQDYFVRRRCEPTVRALEYTGAKTATMSQGLRAALANTSPSAIVICPSNPYLSISPILAIEDIRTAIAACGAPVYVVSPIIGGVAVKGPAAKIMRELGHVVSPVTVARWYAEIIDGMIIDEADSHLRGEIEAMGVRVRVCQALMRSAEDQVRLAEITLGFAFGDLPSRHKVTPSA